MHTGARAREQKYISIYISLCMKTFLKTGIYNIYIYTSKNAGHCIFWVLKYHDESNENVKKSNGNTCLFGIIGLKSHDNFVVVVCLFFFSLSLV